MEKKTAATRVLCLVVLMLIGVTALAQDSKSSTITINGGRTTVNMKVPSNMAVHQQGKVPAGAFYNNIGTGYVAGSGYTVSDGSPIGTEYTPGIQFVSLKSGTTKKLSVGVGFVTGTNGATVTLDKDCKGIPCGTIDKTHMCKGKVTNLPAFGSTSTIVKTIKCAVALKKGKPYWVYIESLDNSWLAWNFSTSATGGVIEGTDDVWGSPASGQPVSALRIK